MNFSEHNFAWHDMMIRVEHTGLARFLREDFDSSWEGRSLANSRSFADIDADVHLLAGAGNPERMAPLVSMVRGARRSIDIVSPYLSPPFTDHVAHAAERGARVRVITPKDNNKRYLQRFLLAEAPRLGYDVRLYEPGMIHMKCMLIDDRALITGSSNFDLMSYNGFLAEVVAVFRAQAVIADFRRLVLEPDLEASAGWVPSTGGRSRLRRALSALPIRMAALLASVVRPRGKVSP